MSWTLTTSGACVAKAGLTEAQVLTPETISGAILLQWSDEAEAIICDNSRYDVVTNFATLTANGVQILGNLASNLIGQKIATYLRANFSQREFETILDIIENDVRRGLSLTKEDNIKTYFGAT